MLEGWELRPGERFAIPKDELHSAAPVLIRRKDASNITFGFSWIAPRKLEPSETYAMNVLNHILNGTTNSRIFGQARKRGLVYGMGSDTSNGWHNTSWDFDGEVNAESAEKLFDLIHTEIIKILNGDISDNDIDAAKSYATGRYQMGAQTVGQIADFYADNYFMNGTIGKYDSVPNEVRKIKKVTMVDLAREFISSGINAFVAVSSIDKASIVNLAERLKFS